MFCSISGEIPLEPVVSKKSGHLFEKRLIEKAVSTTGLCPVTGESLDLNDLIPVINTKPISRPRPPSATSIPGLISLFQKEWDSLMLESYSLKDILSKTREELAHALYQHDAACRVIARLIDERDEARRLCSMNLQQHKHKNDTDDNENENTDDNRQRKRQKQFQVSSKIEMEIDDQEKEKDKELDGFVVDSIINGSSKLCKERKSRNIPEDLVSAEDFSNVKCRGSFFLHDEHGISSLDISKNLCATAGVDGKGKIFDWKSENVPPKDFQGHTGSLTKIKFVHFGEGDDDGLILSSSKDKTVRLWGINMSEKHCFSYHSQEVTGFSIHPCCNFFSTGSLDGSWTLIDLTKQALLSRAKNTNNSNSISNNGIPCIEFHPDGKLLGTGTIKGDFSIWDVTSQKIVANFEGHKTRMTDVSFNNNGYYVATSDEDGLVKLWDLRKQKDFLNMDLQCANSVQFDDFGSFLAVGSEDSIKIYSGRRFKHVADLSGHIGTVNDICFGPNAQFLASASSKLGSDDNLKFWDVKSSIWN